MHRSLTISQRGLLVVIFLVATEVLFVGILAPQIFSLQASLKQQHRERTIVTHIAHLIRQNVRMNFGLVREQFLTLRSDNVKKSSYPMYIAHIDKELDALHELVKDSPKELRDWNSIQDAKREYIDDTEKSFAIGLSMTKEHALSSQLLRLRVSDRTQKFMSHFGIDDESSQRTRENLDQIRMLLALGFFGNLFAVLVAGLYFWRQVSNRIEQVTENVARFGQGEPLLEIDGGNDEIGAVDALFRRLGSELETAAEQERAFFLHSIDVICSLDSRGVFTDVSPACFEQWGFTPEELIGATASSVLKTALIPSVFLDSITDVSRDERFEAEDTVTRKDGTFVDTLWSAQWSAANGSFFCFVRDASESKRFEDLLLEQEEQIRQSIDNMPLGIIAIGDDSTIQTANKTATVFFNDKQNLRGVAIDELLLPIAADRSVSKLLREGGTSTAIRCSTIGAGERRFLDLTLGDDQSGQLAQQGRMIVLFEDATERVSLERMKHDYVTLLGQRLRDPLAKVRSIISAQRDTTINEQSTAPTGAEQAQLKRQQRIERTVSNIDRLLKLIDELLDIEKLASGKLVEELTPCSVNDIVHGAIGAVRDHAELQKLSVTSQHSESVVLADEQRLVQVVVNLLTNAIKYSPPNTVIAVEQIDLGNEAEIRVIDQGRGLPAHMHEKIFESYVQVKASDAKRGTGTGLGLAICKQIVEKHGGRIGVESEEGKGSTFWIRLPKLLSEGGSSS